ncbi:MAG: SDR family oxidoreductase [Bacteroidales bacterium]|jgi:pteridine reductase|nr:SDR family oxidoreductase [Bacteroidales bacterium]
MNTNQCQHPKAVLITGAADRIGLEMAKECLDCGYHVVIHYRTSAEPAKSIFTGDGRVAFIQADLTESTQKFMNDVKKLPFALEGLINNASIFQTGNMSNPDHFLDILTINTLIPIRLAAEFVKGIDKGWIINITDARVRPMNKKYQSYRTSKIFLDEITRQLAFLYAPSIRVNAIAPGAVLPVRHDAAENSTSGDGQKRQFDELAELIPMGKTGDPAHIRQTVKFLIENDYITGAVIPVDGGWGI